MSYTATADELVERIRALIPAHPEIMTMTDPNDLIAIGFKFEDLQPSFFQVSWALNRAKSLGAP